MFTNIKFTCFAFSLSAYKFMDSLLPHCLVRKQKGSIPLPSKANGIKLSVYPGGGGRLLADCPRNIDVIQSCSSSLEQYLCIFHRSHESFPAVLQVYSSIHDSFNRSNEHLGNFPAFLIIYHLLLPLTLFLHCFLLTLS